MKRAVGLSLIVVALFAEPVQGHAGDLDPTYSDDGIATAFAAGSVANAVAIDHAGRSVVVGQTIGDHVVVAVARFRPDGTPDPTFGGDDGRIKLPLGGDAAAAFDVAVASRHGLAIVGRRSRWARG